MILPPTGGPPPKGAAVRGRMELETLEPLKHVAADVNLKHCWERQVNPLPPPPAQGGAQAPKPRVQYLSQNGYFLSFARAMVQGYYPLHRALVRPRPLRRTRSFMQATAGGCPKRKRHPWATALRGFRRSTVMTKSKQATGKSNRNYGVSPPCKTGYSLKQKVVVEECGEKHASQLTSPEKQTSFLAAWWLWGFPPGQKV